jgi:hypothetical protein
VGKVEKEVMLLLSPSTGGPQGAPGSLSSPVMEQEGHMMEQEGHRRWEEDGEKFSMGAWTGGEAATQIPTPSLNPVPSLALCQRQSRAWVAVAPPLAAKILLWGKERRGGKRGSTTARCRGSGGGREMVLQVGGPKRERKRE